MQILQDIANANLVAAFDQCSSPNDGLVGVNATLSVMPTPNGPVVVWCAIASAKSPLLGQPMLVHADHLDLPSLLSPELTLDWARAALEGLRASRASQIS